MSTPAADAPRVASRTEPQTNDRLDVVPPTSDRSTNNAHGVVHVARTVGLPVGPVALSLYRLALAAQSGRLVKVKAAAGWDAFTWKHDSRSGVRSGGRIELRNENHPLFDVGVDGRAKAAFDRLAMQGSVAHVAAVWTNVVACNGRSGGWHGVDVVRLLRSAGDHRDRYCPLVEDLVLLFSSAKFELECLTGPDRGRRSKQKRGGELVSLLSFERHNKKSATVSVPARVREQLRVHQVPANTLELNRYDGSNAEGARLSRGARCQSRIGAVIRAVAGVETSSVEDLLGEWAPGAFERAKTARRFGAVLEAFTTDIGAVLGVGTGVMSDRAGSTRARPVRFIATLAARTKQLVTDLHAASPPLLAAALSPPGG